ncbi:MAG TPA: DUF488 domain-containing protein [Allosphingosinicella sp.]|jgi:uncharacterized protein (DUF488 family)|nr:DUF488 domain-containing protein [Allosphingosinicella sp.]
MDDPPVYTIGHSNRPFDEFTALLASAGVRQIVDVRRFPRSRANPQYNIEVLSEALPKRQVRYTIIPELGGRRSGQSAVRPEVNACWRNRSFHNYADYALGEDFAAGLDRLLALAREAPSAIMCSEAVWWRCHRRIIADYLLLDGKAVLHIMEAGRIEEARMTPGAVVTGNRLTYPAC